MLSTHQSVLPVASMLHSHAMVARSPVGEESVDLQQSSLKPVEQLAHTDNITWELDKLRRSAEEELAKAQKRLHLQEQAEISKLAARDREVRNHERAHAAVGGQYAGAPRYEYHRGPDGVNYAIAGEVSISTGPIPGDPQMTIEKAQIIKRAALAPAEPSPQDRKVAAQAMQLEMQARAELSEMQQQERLQEGQQSEDSSMKKDVEKTPLNSHENAHSEDPVDSMNLTQEEAFNEINNDLTAQLVALGVSQQQPQSIGNIVSRFV